MKNYIIIEAESASELESKINNKLNDYRPIGGLEVFQTKNSYGATILIYSQALIRLKTKKGGAVVNSKKNRIIKF